jgi:hypothetical protein
MPDTTAFTSADWFLAGFHHENSSFSFIKTNRKTLHQVPFHDGRTSLAVSNKRVSIRLEEAIEWLSGITPSSHPQRIIAHTSFCGSTLLVRALDIHGRVLSYREPQVLIDLANLKAAKHKFSLQREKWSAILQFTFLQFQKSWNPAEQTLIKPSNWANNILPDLADLQPDTKYILLSMGLEDYLIANLRGGKSRLKFSLDLLNHLTAKQPAYQATIKDIEKLPLTQMQRILYLLAYCYHLQHDILKTIEQKSAADNVMRLDKADLTEKPDTSIQHVAETLELSAGNPALQRNTRRAFKKNAKSDNEKKFDTTQEDAMNESIKNQLGADISQAVTWYEATYATT